MLTLSMFGLLSLAVALPMVNAACDANYPYRLMNGTCNNLDNHNWASAGMTMHRLTAPRNRETGSEPNERTVTRTLLSGPDRGKFDADLDATERAMGTEMEGRGLNAYAVIMMQFVSHDISLTPVTSFFDQGAAFGITIPNCEEEADVGVNDELCALTGDRRGGTLLQNKLVTRDSIGEMDSDGNLTPNNAVSGYLDLNPVYGSNDETAHNLRSFTGGKLVIGVNDTLPRNSPTGAFTENECDLFGPSDRTHMAGDVRVDENFVLTSIHLLFLREHNRIADQFAASNPSWDDEKLYQESRKRNIAVYQRILFDEILPGVYGKKATKQILGKYQGYDSTVNPSASVEFTTAAFRLHSMVNLPSLFLSGNCDLSKGVVSPSENPYVMQERTNCDPVDYRRIGHEDVIRGALIQHAQEYDNHVTRTLMNIRIGAPGNVDVQAANIFRGRQHCLGTIDELRQSVGMSSVYDDDTRRELATNTAPHHHFRKMEEEEGGGCFTGNEIECFQKLTPNATLAEQMHAMYEHVDNVDLYIALVGEKHMHTTNNNGSSSNKKQSSCMGETSTRVGLQQFQKLRDGDRFWYEKAGILSQGEMREVKDMTLSDLLKMNFPEMASEIPDDVLQTMPSECIISLTEEENSSSSSEEDSSSSDEEGAAYLDISN